MKNGSTQAAVEEATEGQAKKQITGVDLPYETTEEAVSEAAGRNSTPTTNKEEATALNKQVGEASIKGNSTSPAAMAPMDSRHLTKSYDKTNES